MLLEVQLYLPDADGVPDLWRISHYLGEDVAKIYGPNTESALSMKFNANMWTLADAQEYLDAFLRNHVSQSLRVLQ